jgi:hypothetical protein
MRTYKKALLLFVFCFAMLSTTAAKPDMVTDTLIKITVNRVVEIFSTPTHIQITQKYGKIKISYQIIEGSDENVLVNDPDYRKFIERQLEQIEKKVRDTSFISPYVMWALKHRISQRDTIATSDMRLKELTAEMVISNTEGKDRLNIDDIRVLDGYFTYFEIITPAGTRRIVASTPAPDSNPLLYNVIKKCVDIYREKHPNARIPALGL